VVSAKGDVIYLGSFGPVAGWNTASLRTYALPSP
jgi:hypothetical protein